MAATLTARPSALWDEDLVGLYRNHHGSLIQTAIRTVRSTALAEEIVHDAFVTFHTNNCQPKPGRELAYLRTMVVNRGHSVTRRTIRGEELTVPDWFSDPGPEDETIDRLDAEAVQKAIGHLSDRQQQVLTLRYVHGYSEAEIADALGISRGSVKTHALRGREALRSALGPMF